MTDKQKIDLFGDVIDDFKTAKERYGTWPITVWDVDFQDATMRKLKQEIGDGCGEQIRVGGRAAYASERNNGGAPQYSGRQNFTRLGTRD